MPAATEIKLIHIARQALGIDDATYRQMLANLCAGKTSSKDLTIAERQKVLAHLKARGFKVKRKNGGATHDAWRREPQMRKLRAIWYQLAEVAAVEQPADAKACDAAIEAWAKHELPQLDALRFAGGDQMSKLIEQAKAWGLRVGAAIE